MVLYQVNWSWTSDCEEWLSSQVFGFSLNVCCGISKVGSVRVDLDSSLKPDVVASVFCLPFVDGCFDSLVCDPPFDLLYKNSVLVDGLVRFVKSKIIISHPPSNICLSKNWVKSVFVSEQGTYFLSMWTVFNRSNNFFGV